MSDYLNEKEKIDAPVNEYGEKISPKNEMGNYRSKPYYNGYSQQRQNSTRRPARRPALPPRGVSPAAFGRQQAEQRRQAQFMKQNGIENRNEPAAVNTDSTAENNGARRTYRPRTENRSDLSFKGRDYGSRRDYERRSTELDDERVDVCLRVIEKSEQTCTLMKEPACDNSKYADLYPESYRIPSMQDALCEAGYDKETAGLVTEACISQGRAQKRKGVCLKAAV